MRAAIRYDCERGQALPLIGLIGVGALVLGLLVFRAGAASDMGAQAQTGADAVALAMVINHAVWQDAEDARNLLVREAADAAAEGVRDEQRDERDEVLDERSEIMRIARQANRARTDAEDERIEELSDRLDALEEAALGRGEAAVENQIEINAVASARQLDDMRASEDALAAQNGVRVARRQAMNGGDEAMVVVQTTARLGRFRATGNQSAGAASAHAAYIERNGKHSGKLVDDNMGALVSGPGAATGGGVGCGVVSPTASATGSTVPPQCPSPTPVVESSAVLSPEEGSASDKSDDLTTSSFRTPVPVR